MSLLYKTLGAKPSLTKWIIGSVLFHVAAATIFGFVMKGDDAPPAAPPSIKTRLVKLGKQRDPKLLPRTAEPPPAAPPTPKAKPPEAPPAAAPKTDVTKKTTTPTKTKQPQKSASDLLKNALAGQSASSAADLLKNRIEEDAEGSEQGTVMGTELSGRLKASYNDKILAHMKQNLAVPNSLSDEQRVGLRASVSLSIGPDGNLGFVKIKTSSKHPGFDNAVVACVRGSAPFPAPPPTLRDFYRGGVVVDLCPVRCR